MILALPYCGLQPLEHSQFCTAGAGLTWRSARVQMTGFLVSSRTHGAAFSDELA
jgi:hypothetical protein